MFFAPRRRNEVLESRYAVWLLFTIVEPGFFYKRYYWISRPYNVMSLWTKCKNRENPVDFRNPFVFSAKYAAFQLHCPSAFLPAVSPKQQRPSRDLTFGALAVWVEIRKYGRGRVPRAHQPGPYQPFALLGPNDFHFWIVFRVLVQLRFQMGCENDKNTRLDDKMKINIIFYR